MIKGMEYWLLKTEPTEYSIDDLKQQKVGMWDGVRNYQARNLLRKMKKGDIVLVYHSSTDIRGVAGIGTVAKEAYSDPTQFQKKSSKYDSHATEEKPRWSAVDIRFLQKFKTIVTLEKLKSEDFFNDMLVTKQGVRLSVQPVHIKHYQRIVSYGNK